MSNITKGFIVCEIVFVQIPKPVAFSVHSVD